MTEQFLIDLGFSFETLPSGRINLHHTDRFSVNGIQTIARFGGKWTRTFEQRSTNDLVKYIKEISMEEVE